MRAIDTKPIICNITNFAALARNKSALASCTCLSNASIS